MQKKFKVSKTLSLPVNQSSDKKRKEFIPKAFDYKGDGGLVEKIAVSINKKMPVLLVGETGVGKTSLIRYLADKTNNAFRRVNHNGGTTSDDIIGRILINKEGTYWVDGVLVDAMRNGYWYFADEISAASPEVNFVYHSLLDDDSYVVLAEKDGEIVRAHEDFRFFAAMNPAIGYAGTRELNKALLSRFIVFKMDFPDPKIEKKILVSRTNIDPNVASKMLNFAMEVRGNQSNEKIDFILSTRELLMWANLFGVYKRYIVSAEMSILNKVAPEDFDSIKDLMALHFKGLDEQADKDKDEELMSKGGVRILEEKIRGLNN